MSGAAAGRVQRCVACSVYLMGQAGLLNMANNLCICMH